jgi:endonuclease-3
VGLDPKAILKAPQATLLALAKLGGMQPETRVIRWREIARITVNQFGDDLDRILREPYENAKKALKAFPSIGDPGAEKILLFSGVHRGLPLESNGLRVLTRVGFGRVQKSYSSTYRSVQEVLQDQLPSNAADLLSAHLLLRQHGTKYCRNNSPLCRTCPLSSQCAYPMK